MPCATNIRSSSMAIPGPAPVRADWPWPKWLFTIQRHCSVMRERSRQRSALWRLDDRLLVDIGISREQALREAKKWSWTP